MLPISLRESVIAKLSDSTGTEVQLLSTHPLSGGCINQAFKLHTNTGDYFIKWNDAQAYPGMFEAEAKGLQLLSEARCIAIPDVLHEGLAATDSFLLLSYVEEGNKAPGFWDRFGTSLARLHQNSHSHFGLDHANYIGSLPQSNRPQELWTDFFVLERLEPQLQQAVDNGVLSTYEVRRFQLLFEKLEDLVPKEVPALLHGDLWSGNFLVNHLGAPVLIDPAVYYGHREMDLAMTRLFGGFSPDFYHAYQQAFPPEKGWEERMDLCNLYPLLVHVNLFGGGYAGQVSAILKYFVV